MSRFALAFALLATLSACDRSGPDSAFDGLSGNPALLAGTWTWERTTNCGDGSGGCTDTTPASTGRAETLTFTHTPEAALQDGTVAGYFNGSALDLTPYQVITAVIDYADRSEGVYFLSLETRGQVRFGVSADRLVISDAAVDGPTTTYRRRR